MGTLDYRSTLYTLSFADDQTIITQDIDDVQFANLLLL